jgi:hypothetical protein
MKLGGDTHLSLSSRSSFKPRVRISVCPEPTVEGANLGRFRNPKSKVDGKSLESKKSMASHSKVSLEVNTAHVLMELSTTKDVSTSISVEQYLYQ